MGRPERLRSKIEKISWLEARKWADELQAMFAPRVSRIAVCGSVRRMSRHVHDIELLAIPASGALLADVPDATIDDFVCANRRFSIQKNGPKYKQFQYLDAEGFPQVLVDLFVVDRDSWGYHEAIRTGPADFSRLCVTRQLAGGFLRNDLFCSEGRVLNELAQPLSVPTEAEFFEHCLTIDFVEPCDRWEHCGRHHQRGAQ